MRMTEEDYVYGVEGNVGYCPSTDQISDIQFYEPDAEGYPCVCGGRDAMGLEQALILGHIAFDELLEETSAC